MSKTCTAVGVVSEGDAVCLLGFDGQPKVGRANLANLAMSKTVYGVARADAADEATDLLVDVAGDVTESTIHTSLAAGAAAGSSRIVATNTSYRDALTPSNETAQQCRLVRVDQPDGSEYVVGTCDESGNLAVQPRASIETSPVHTFNVCAFGAVPYSSEADARKGTSSTRAFQAALDAMGDAAWSPAGAGGELVVPNGFYNIDGDLVVRRSGHLRGFGTGGRYAKSVLVFAKGKHIEFLSHVDAAPGNDQFIRVEALMFLGTIADMPIDQGVLVRSTAHFRFCSFIKFDGIGVEVFADASQGKKAANANHFSFDQCWFEDNQGHGLYVHGGNTNASSIVNCTAVTNGRSEEDYGFFDSSQGGNLYLHCSVVGPDGSSTRVGSIKTDSNASMLIGCYTEGLLTPVWAPDPALVIGGSLENVGFTAEVAQAVGLRIINSQRVSPFVVANDVGIVRTETYVGRTSASSNSPDSVPLGWAVPRRNPLQIASVTNPNAAPIEVTTVAGHFLQTGMTVTIDKQAHVPDGTYTITFVDADTFEINLNGDGTGTSGTLGTVTGDEDSNDYQIAYDYEQHVWYVRAGGRIAFALSGTRHVLGIGRMMFEQGYFVGSGSNRRFVTLATQKPSDSLDPGGRADGSWEVGDRVLARDPSSGNPYEWVCTTGGPANTSVWADLLLP
jgi:hypothetical protein